jgi:uncharacterized membrane protein
MMGDFFIQKSSRLVGVWHSLGYISFLGSIGIFPFVKEEIPALMFNAEAIQLFSLAAIVALFASLFDFEALKEGKFSIIEPLLGIELPLTVGLSIALGGEVLSILEGALIVITFLGIILSVTAHVKHLHYHKRLLEKGVIYAGVGAIGMALMNFLVGHASQETSALATIWFIHSFVALFVMIYIISRGQLKEMFTNVKKNFSVIVPESILDNLAWIFYAFATTLIPISIATTISESYIVGGVLLGVLVNKERLKKHQFVGVVLTMGSVLMLSVVS